MGKPTDGTTAGIDGEHVEVTLFDVSEIPRELNLAEKFIVPPFSILAADGGWWQGRKRQWKDIGLRSEEGRDVRAYGSNTDTSDLGQHINSISGGQSIFDPTLTELAYRWFCPPGGKVIDPFSGGSVRGVVASYFGHHYTGIDLSERQIEANYVNLSEIEKSEGKLPGSINWVHGDSLVTVPKVVEPESQDMCLSCPPYYDLEVYSDGDGDISAMTWENFLQNYREIIAATVASLKPNTFVVWVITEIRDKKTGLYRNFVGETVRAFEDAGASYYNEIILATPVGSVAQMSEKQMRASRKIGRRHQNVQIYVKGDPKKATQNLDPIKIV